MRPLSSDLTAEFSFRAVLEAQRFRGTKMGALCGLWQADHSPRDSERQQGHSAYDRGIEHDTYARVSDHCIQKHFQLLMNR